MSQMTLWKDLYILSSLGICGGGPGGNHSPKSEAVGKNERREGTKGGEEICVNFKQEQ